MKILLCASKTPDTTTKIVFTPDNKSLQTAGVQYILNPYDDHALARAMDIKEKTNGHLTVIHVGDQATAEPVLRRCLAIGVDEAILVNTLPVDAYLTAAQIAAATSGQTFDLIMTGRESIDFNGNQVGDLLGEMLGIPSIDLVADVAFENGVATMTRFIDGGEEKVSVNLPIVISATKELAEPRIPNMRGIMQARTKQINIVQPAAIEPLVELTHFESPPKKSGPQYIDASEASKLIDLLHEKEKII